MPGQKSADANNVKRVGQAETDAKIVEMRKAGVSYREIGDVLGVTLQHARQGFRRGLATIPQETAEEMTQLVMGRMDYVTKEMVKVISHFHPVVNNGHIIFNPDTGEMFDDDLPKIAAAKILVGIQERVSRLWGLDAPRTSINVSIDAIDAEIRKLEDEIGKDIPRGDGGMRQNGRQRHEPKAIEGPPGFR